jgi:hypothetical protein
MSSFHSTGDGWVRNFVEVASPTFLHFIDNRPKQPGVGREGGMHSMGFYTELRNVCVST